MRAAIAPELVVDELTPIVRIDAAQGKGEGLAHLLQRCTDGPLSLAQHGARLDPGGVDIGEIERVQAVALAHGPAVRDQLDLDETGDGDLPAIDFERDVVLEQGAGFGTAIEVALQGLAAVVEDAIHGAGAHGLETSDGVRGAGEALGGPGEPQR